MLIKYHKRITRKALSNEFSRFALEEVIDANIMQDSLIYQLGHDHFHFDNNAFQESRSYMKDLQDQLFFFMKDKKPKLARECFGRLAHTCQDLYAHSNYVTLWLRKFDSSSLPAPDNIDPCDPEILTVNDLRSGRLYYPFEILSFIPAISKLVLPFLPKDSHAHMNLDSPARGELFPYAFEAAVKRTKIELETIKEEFTADQFNLFSGTADFQNSLN